MSEASRRLPTSHCAQSPRRYTSRAQVIELNKAAFATLLIRQRVLMDVSRVKLECTALGMQCAVPMYLSPIAKGGLVAEDETTFVRAAHRARVPYVVPTVSTASLAHIYKAAHHALPFQFYLLGDNRDSLQKLADAVALGCSAVVITVDANAPRKGSLLSSTQATSGVSPKPTFHSTPRPHLSYHRRSPLLYFIASATFQPLMVL